MSRFAVLLLLAPLTLGCLPTRPQPEVSTARAAASPSTEPPPPPLTEADVNKGSVHKVVDQLRQELDRDLREPTDK